MNDPSKTPDFVKGSYFLAGGEQSSCYPGKLTEYALNPGDSAADNKAKVFESASGFAKETADNLVIEDKQGVMNHTPVPGKADQLGVRFTACVSVTGPADSGAWYWPDMQIRY